MTAPIASGWSEIAGWALHPLESAALSRRTPIAAVHRTSGTDGVALIAVIRRRSRDRPDRQPVVAYVDHGMVDPEGRSQARSAK